MVADEVSLPKIKNYFACWLRWWARTVTAWNLKELANQFIHTCWDETVTKIATDFCQHYVTGLHNRAILDNVALHAAA